MNIYFACSITGGRELESTYQQIVAALLGEGHEIPTSYLAQAESMEIEGRLTPEFVYKRDTKWIRECDVLIAEVSVPSHGVGYEIGYALILNKPVLCLYQSGRRITKMISGNLDKNLTLIEYSKIEDAIKQARNYLRSK